MSGDSKSTSLSGETPLFPPPERIRSGARIHSQEQYHEMYRRSVEDPEGFWAEYARELYWNKTWDSVVDEDFDQGRTRWFIGGKLNAAYNCLDRHIQAGWGDRKALIWEGENGETKTFTYEALHGKVCQVACGLRRMGLRKGDRVAIYLPMIPELFVAMLACARIGAVHSVVFNQFSPDSLRERMRDCGAQLLITSDYSLHQGRPLPAKRNADIALDDCPEVKNVVVVRRTGKEVDMTRGRDRDWEDFLSGAGDSTLAEPEVMDAEDPLFILYTSGSTGKPKGVLHTTAGYLLHAKKSFEWVFDYREGDLFWCTEDLSWIIGHTYSVYGPLSAGAILLMAEGSLAFPKPDRPWVLVDRHHVNILYTTPAFLRTAMKEGTRWVEGRNLRSLRVLGSVGEPINPDVWMWFYKNIGKESCPLVDTWWQTETGGILITPFPGATPLKPGSAALPFFGVRPAVLREDGSECEVQEGGYLVLKGSAPGMMRTVHGHPARFQELYFSFFPKSYFTGDAARKDEDGYFWLLGRVDDVIHSSGTRLGTTEIENALVSHEAVAEAAVVPFPHPLKGQGIYAFVTLRSGFAKSEGMKQALIEHVQKKIGLIATPDKIQLVDVLSKTLSGKIMRRILRKIAAGDVKDLGDTSTLANPSVVRDLLGGKQ